MSWVGKARMMLEMIRFSHTIFALPFALLAAELAWWTPTRNGEPIGFRWQDLFGILLCMVTARSSAMAFNRLIDAKFDAENPRTKQRHLPSGKLTSRGVGVFTTVNVLLFCAATLLFLPNRLPIYLALPVLGILFFYSYTKRITALAHYWLGLALMLAPIAVWIALRGNEILAQPVDILPVFTLGLAVLFWVGGFDIIYACQDEEFDRAAKLYSIPAKFGVAGALRIAVISHGATVVLLALVPLAARVAGLEHRLGWIYYSGVFAVAVLLIYQHWLVRPDDLTRVNAAFFNVNAIISFGLFVVCTIDTLVS